MKNTLFLTLLLFTFNTVFSQVEKESSRIKVYTPETSNVQQNSYKWTVKTDLFSYIAGEFPLIAEYRISNKFSIEGTVGLTYSFWDNNLSIFDMDNDSEYELDTEASIGSVFRTGIKYYPSSDWDAIEGWAFGVQLFRKTNNRKYIEDSEFNNLSDFKDTKTKTGVALTISKQVFWDSNISYEYLVGFGFANVNRKYANAKYIDNKYILTEGNDKKTTPVFLLGLRIGFGN